MREADNDCDFQCNLLWDGFGRWVTGYKWKPYMNFTEQGTECAWADKLQFKYCDCSLFS